MKSRLNRRTIGVLLTLLGSQLLSACIVLPVPGSHRHGGIIVEGGHRHRDGPSHGGHHGHRHDRDDRGHRDGRR